jgi:hypothetical protein
MTINTKYPQSHNGAYTVCNKDLTAFQNSKPTIGVVSNCKSLTDFEKNA